MILLYTGLGRLIIWTLQVAGPLEWFRQRAPGLFECDFCLGFWVYLGLAFLFGHKFVASWNTSVPYVVVVSEVLLALTTSFVVHLVRMGWEAKFNAE